MNFEFIKVIPWPDKGWRIQWSINGIEPGHKIIIEKASGQEGPWEQISEEEWNSVYFLYHSAAYRSNFEQYYYRIKVLDSEDDEQLVSRVFGQEFSPELATMEVIRRHEIVLYGVNGHPGFMSRIFACFKRTIDGTRCHFCINPHTHERTQEKCNVCKGTGYIEGWSNPILFKGRWRDRIQKQSRRSTYGEKDKEERRLWLSAYPILEIGDILIEKSTNKMFEVVTIGVTQPDNIVLSQNAQCSNVDRDFIESTSLRFPEDEDIQP